MKRVIKISFMSILIITLIAGFSGSVLATGQGINEKLGAPIIVYGETLSASQEQEVRELLDVQNPENVQEYTVTGEDIAKYINGNPNSNMYSSAKITREEKGSGLSINIVTPDNITQVTTEMYANALLTAGVENATVDVASPVKVSGHSALTGIYKAYDEQGVTLDKDRMQVADEELGVATDLANNEGLSQEKVSELLTEIKKTIAEQNPATKEEVRQIVEEELNNLEISLSDADRQMLIDLFEKMRNLDINFDNVSSQLEDIASQVQDKISDIVNDEGFWTKVKNFFQDIFNAIRNFFQSIFG
ncbi:DUF1002 domain-containing protein [Virgibacillus siamensis]|uniref:DUF1002 domain-containing protein n=1 Tax=Virgibacillus siamensis TaxID=480071 RepID=A0ABN1G9C3_9BACI